MLNQNEINYSDLIIGKQYTCKCYTIVEKLTIEGILTNSWDSFVFVRTNKPQFTFQVFPNKVVSFYENIDFPNILPCKILEPYTSCPISYEDFEDGDEIITIDDRYIYKKDILEEWLQHNSKNPLTNQEINETQVKYFTVIILPFID